MRQRERLCLWRTALEKSPPQSTQCTPLKPRVTVQRGAEGSCRAFRTTWESGCCKSYFPLTLVALCRFWLASKKAGAMVLLLTLLSSLWLPCPSYSLQIHQIPSSIFVAEHTGRALQTDAGAGSWAKNKDNAFLSLPRLIGHSLPSLKQILRCPNN